MGKHFFMNNTVTTSTTPSLMLQGTSSNAGKSVLTAALCRILLQDGLSVAPFKAQNMALNSFVTPNGEEIGRAQAVQAAACRLEPDVRMNPVLLKPSSDTGSQVIVMGKPVANMRVKEYVKYKPTAFAHVQSAYDSIAAEHDVMVLEGAGSPAEINLKAHDIVNMQMARYAKAKVLLVGDIDRGGVFASLVGTMELLDAWEKDLVAGFVLNRFRGDVTLLDSALDFTTNRTEKSFFGVVPFLTQLGLPEEDSVTFKESIGRQLPLRDDALDIVLLDLPHIANFTDVDALTIEPDVSLRVVNSLDKLGKPDCIIIPGSKNTPGDLHWLHESGLAVAIINFAKAGGVVTGICGGFQMLGETVSDPVSIEYVAQQSSEIDVHLHATQQGLGLLPLRTVMGEEKVLTRVTAIHAPTGNSVTGYEIHHGITESTGAQKLDSAIIREDGVIIGYGLADSHDFQAVWGTYLHGVFDDDKFRRAFINDLRVRKGLAPLQGVQASFSIDPALDRLADTVRDALDMKKIYEVLGL
ncbi:cobyric acid synthase [Halodesulfovibrio marinisediminis]|uniref:Cobyric acid synthase n=1 Tax=Halodesulfovibrio marinisediminis DSM 17456 TaxID=1121457 RepID=A0A1N6ITE0_9BACT|nr:cobyric acid synthase [Halodesulfovibrio marinisediminis]SIO35258.1 adenosylcobyric acid synthase (glutamine-hydrolysing) [Halodesulfovibrio marinisediminis DSM 17456]